MECSISQSSGGVGVLSLSLSEELEAIWAKVWAMANILVLALDCFYACD